MKLNLLRKPYLFSGDFGLSKCDIFRSFHLVYYKPRLNFHLQFWPLQNLNESCNLQSCRHPKFY